MKIIPLINEITNSFNEIFKNNLNPFNLESKIRDVVLKELTATRQEIYII